MLRYELRNQPLLPRRQFVLRIGRHVLLALALMSVFLLLGTLGYHWLAGMVWLDAVLNAAMILSGMGPVNAIDGAAGKWFATGYALIAGLIFTLTTGERSLAMLHRVFHSLHVKGDE